jgi:hypothetical protein
MLVMSTFILVITNLQYAPKIPPSHETSYRLAEMMLDLNTTVSPCDDFWQHACGNYPLRHPKSNTPFDVSRATLLRHLELSGQNLIEQCKTTNDTLDVTVHTPTIWDRWAAGMSVNGVYISPIVRNGQYTLLVSGPDNEMSYEYQYGLPECMTHTVPEEYANIINNSIYWGDEYDICTALYTHDDIYTTISINDCEAYVEEFFPNTLYATHISKIAEAVVIAEPALIDLLLNTNITYQIGGGYRPYDDPENVASIDKMVKAVFVHTMQWIGNAWSPTHWWSSVFQVNAFYSPMARMITIPYGIMRPPFFHPTYPSWLNAAGLYTVFTHELSHSRDTFGSQFPTQQRWQPQSTVSTELAEMLEAEIISISNMTMALASNERDELIADHLGFKLYEHTYKPHTQLEYYQYAQMWCERNSAVSNDTHPPGKWRVNMTIRSSDTWAALFGCAAIKNENYTHLVV